jgi:hypothetical protein
VPEVAKADAHAGIAKRLMELLDDVLPLRRRTDPIGEDQTCLDPRAPDPLVVLRAAESFHELECR